MTQEEVHRDPSAKNAILVSLIALIDICSGPMGERNSIPLTSTPSLRTPRLRPTQTGRSCMPARHDMLCGVQDFLWRPWGLHRALGGADHPGPRTGRGHYHARKRSPPSLQAAGRVPHQLDLHANTFGATRAIHSAPLKIPPGGAPALPAREATDTPTILPGPTFGKRRTTPGRKP